MMRLTALIGGLKSQEKNDDDADNNVNETVINRLNEDLLAAEEDPEADILIAGGTPVETNNVDEATSMTADDESKDEEKNNGDGIIEGLPQGGDMNDSLLTNLNQQAELGATLRAISSRLSTLDCNFRHVSEIMQQQQEQQEQRRHQNVVVVQQQPSCVQQQEENDNYDTWSEDTPCCWRSDMRCYLCTWPSCYLLGFYWLELSLLVTRGSTNFHEHINVHRTSQLWPAIAQISLSTIFLIVSLFSLSSTTVLPATTSQQGGGRRIRRNFDCNAVLFFILPYLGIFAINVCITLKHNFYLFQTFLDVTRYAFLFFAWAARHNVAAAFVSAILHCILILEAARINLIHGHNSLRQIQALLRVVLLFQLLHHAARCNLSKPYSK